MKKSARSRWLHGWALGLTLVIVALWACAEPDSQAQPSQETEATIPSYQDLIAQLAASAEADGKTVISGREDWLFFAPELRHLSLGRFWGEAAVEVSRATDPSAADPVPAILDFKAQLDRVGVELLFVPVPAKAAIYPQYLPGADPASTISRSKRIDVFDRELLQILTDQGVPVLDLTPVFLEHRGDEPFYCRHDTHWSPRACKVTARHIVEALGEKAWMAAAREAAAVESKMKVEEQEVAIRGDLWLQLPEPRPAQERLTVERVGTTGPAGLEALEPWRESPVLLLGDSHTLVFHAGDDLHATGGGLADHLALQLGFPVDLIGVRGSGATPARVNLLRRRDSLAGKKWVIWCLSVREYTEGQGWKKVPIVK